RFLAGEYSVDAEKPKLYDQWRKSHQPFHGLAEFYGIMASGGFDVIIGNPPWIEYAKVKNDYTVIDYETETCGNLHSVCTERGLRIRSSLGGMSFIVQLPMVSSSRMHSGIPRYEVFAAGPAAKLGHPSRFVPALLFTSPSYYQAER